MKLCGRILLFAAVLISSPAISVNAQTWKELFDKADSLYWAANYDSAIVIGENALSIISQEFPHRDSISTVFLNLLGNCQRHLGHFESAESLIVMTLNIRERYFGPMHLEIAKSLNNLADLYWYSGEYADAVPIV